MSESFLIIILALLGFGLSFYIRRTKARGKKLVCVIGEDCDRMVHSAWAETFGIPNEVLGMWYYGFLALSYVVLVFFPGLASPPVMLTLAVISGLAAAFSLFLVAIQAFVIKEWCEWCLASALVSIVIFLLVMV